MTSSPPTTEQHSERTWRVASGPDNKEVQSVLSCQYCRKRKVKCSRDLPSCAICRQSRQECLYPARASKPGPKIGSTRRSRKEHRGSFKSFFKKDRLILVKADGGRTTRNGDQRQSKSKRVRVGGKRDGVETKRALPLSPDTPSSTGSSETQATEIQSLSFIIHPSHESWSPDRARNASITVPPVNGNADSFQACCYGLGIDPGYLIIWSV